jgi:hypothetical protein
VPPPVEKTPEEIEAEERAKVKRKLTALRPFPTPKQVFTARQKKWAFSFLNQPSQYEWNKKDDYTRCLDKQVEAASKTRSTSASRKRDVPQLRDQAKQSVSLPKVFASDASGSVAQPSQDHAYDFATEAGLTLSQLMSGDIMTTPLAWKYEKGKSLVPPVKEKTLQSQMRRLHELYMDIAKGEQEILLLKISKEHFLGEYLIHIEFEEIFQLFNQDALDKSIISSYCNIPIFGNFFINLAHEIMHHFMHSFTLHCTLF